MFSNFDFKGEARRDFIVAAHGEMNAPLRLTQKKNPYVDEKTGEPWSTDEFQLALSTGWEFGTAVRKLSHLKYTIEPNFDNDRLHESQLRYAMDPENAEWGNPTVFARNVPKWVLDLAVDSFQLRALVHQMDVLDDVYQFLGGNVKALVDKSDSADRFLWNKSVEGLRSVRDGMKVYFNVLDATHFSDIEHALLARDLKKHLDRI